jgi:hypothetical protein
MAADPTGCVATTSTSLVVGTCGRVSPGSGTTIRVKGSFTSPTIIASVTVATKTMMPAIALFALRHTRFSSASRSLRAPLALPRRRGMPLKMDSQAIMCARHHSGSPFHTGGQLCGLLTSAATDIAAAARAVSLAVVV